MEWPKPYACMPSRLSTSPAVHAEFMKLASGADGDG